MLIAYIANSIRGSSAVDGVRVATSDGGRKRALNINGK